MSVWIGKLQRYMAKITADGPWWLAGPNLGTFLQSVALTLDGSAETLHQGMKLTQPLRCDPSHLPVIAENRRISIYDTEPEESKRYRLSQWLQLRRQKGTHQGEMRNVQPYFLTSPAMPRIRIVHQSGTGGRATWHTLNPDGSYVRHKQEPSNWNWDDQPELWSRWWALIYTPGTVLETGQTTWGDGSTWNGGQYWNGSEAQVLADLIAMLVDWKAAHSRCAGVALVSDLDAFDPTGTATTLPDGRSTFPDGRWGRLIDPGTGLPTRLQTASWIRDKYRS